MKFSVLMSIYHKEYPDYFNHAMNSIWDDQILKPAQIVLVIDGPLTNALDVAIHSWMEKIPYILKIVRLFENRGLGAALNEGLKFCTNELVARMDTDDIASPDRFKNQIEFMTNNPDIAVSSAMIEEIDQENRVISIRKLPLNHNDIVKFSKTRNPISHPVAIFRKNAVLSVGGYPEFRKSQDYALWSLMLKENFFFGNINEVLLKMRAGDDLLSRRGLSYLKHELKILNYQRNIGFINHFEYIKNLIIRSLIRLVPSFIKKILYRYARI